MVTTARRTLEILLVDDNPADVDLMMEALRDAAVPPKVSSVGDGFEAVRFLRREGGYAHAPRPDLIVTDLNMPKMDGRELLRTIKNDRALQKIPVLVFTTSQSESDIATSYELNANCFITKPLDFDRFLEVARSLEQFWFTTARLPKA